MRRRSSAEIPTLLCGRQAAGLSPCLPPIYRFKNDICDLNCVPRTLAMFSSLDRNAAQSLDRNAAQHGRDYLSEFQEDYSYILLDSAACKGTTLQARQYFTYLTGTAQSPKLLFIQLYLDGRRERSMKARSCSVPPRPSITALDIKVVEANGSWLARPWAATRSLEPGGCESGEEGHFDADPFG